MSIFGSMNFNLDEDYKPESLIPDGAKCNGTITKVEVNEKSYCIVFTVCLNNNEGMIKADGESPVDGTHLRYRVWLPKPGDEKVMTSSGKETKLQWKINNLAESLRNLNIQVNTPEELAEAIENQEWIDKDVICTVGVNEYKGKFSNEISAMFADIEEPF